MQFIRLHGSILRFAMQHKTALAAKRDRFSRQAVIQFEIACRLRQGGLAVRHENEG
jgi:hypothetical protein